MYPEKRDSPVFHFIGIGGIGMSALAAILSQKGVRITGSDLSPTYVTKLLEKEGIEVAFGHTENNVGTDVTDIVYSTAVSVSNVEYQEGLRRRLAFQHRSDLLATLLAESDPLLVTGTHGKTTTSSLLAHTLVDVGLDPTYALGGIVPTLGGNGRYGRGPFAVAEADESDGSFLKLPAFGAIVTNMDLDHMDFWKTERALHRGFADFFDHVASEDHLFWCGDDKRLVDVHPPGLSYGFGTKNALCVSQFKQEGWKLTFDVSFDGCTYSQIEAPMIGAYNALNAASVFGLALRLNVAEENIRLAFSRFRGVHRRVEPKGIFNNVAVFDDYAHHPTEILSTLQALKKCAQGGRLVVAFQPHRYSRTKECLDQFSEAFMPADGVILTEIYGAGEAPIEGVTHEAIRARIKLREGQKLHVSPRSQLAEFLLSYLQPKDLLVTMGAGDITYVGGELLERAENTV